MTTPSPQHPGIFNWFLILFLGVMWGAAFMANKIALSGFSPWTVTAGRISLAAVALLVFGAMTGQGINKIKGRRAWGFIVAYGVIAVAVALTLMSWGQQFVLSAFAGISMGAVPLLVLPLVAVFSPDEGIGPRRIIGVSLGFVGLVVMIGPSAFGDGGSEHQLLGQLACFGTTLCYAIGSIMTRRAPKTPPIAFAAGTLSVGALLVIPVALIIDGIPQDLPTLPLTALLYSALGPTALAAVIRYRVITTAGSVFMSLTNYMVPVWSVVFGSVLLGENMPPQLIWGMLIILTGIATSQSRSLLPWMRGRPTQ